MGKRPSVSLVIVNYNTADQARQMVEGLGDGADEIVIVDNASPNGDVDALRRLPAHVKVLALADNRGYGAGANAGSMICTGEVIVVSNADIGISAADLRSLAAEAYNEGVGLAGPRFVDATGSLVRSSHYRDPGLLTTLWEYSVLFGAVASRLRPEWHPTLRSRQDHDVDHDTLHVLGALMAMPAEAFREVGGFDEGFFLYREETDLCHRLRAAGWRVRHVATVTAVHEGDASSKDERPVPVRLAAVRSHYAFLRKHRGTVVAAIAWLLGVTGSVSWLLTGPRRRFGRDSLSAHFQVVR